MKNCGPQTPTQEYVLRKTHGLNAGNRAQATLQITIEACQLRTSVANRNRIDVEVQNIGGIETGINASQVLKRAHYERRPYEHNHRQGNLPDDEQVSAVEPMASRLSRESAAVLQRGSQIHSRATHRRRQSKNCAGQHRDGRRKQQHTRIERSFKSQRLRRAGIDKSNNRTRPAHSYENAERSAKYREQNALRQQLTDHSSAPSTKREPHRHLFLSRVRTR